jgi:hypothetical protein
MALAPTEVGVEETTIRFRASAPTARDTGPAALRF